jgi:hypothetical protein
MPQDRKISRQPAARRGISVGRVASSCALPQDFKSLRQLCGGRGIFPAGRGKRSGREAALRALPQGKKMSRHLVLRRGNFLPAQVLAAGRFQPLRLGGEYT